MAAADAQDKNFDWFALNGKQVSGMVPPEQASDSTMRAFMGASAPKDPNALRQEYAYTYSRSPEGMQRASVDWQLQNPPPDPKRVATNLLPTGAAMLASYLVPGSAPLAWALRIGAAGLGGAAGETGREKIMDEKLDPMKIGLVGGVNAFGAGVGEGASWAAPLVAKKFMTVGLPRTQAIARQVVKDEARRGVQVSPDEVDLPQQFLDRGYTAGRLNRNMEPGSAQITRDMNNLMAQRAALLDDATNAGVTYNASEMLKYLPQLRAQAAKQSQKAVAALEAAVQDYEATWRLPNGQWKKLTPVELEEQKELWADMGKSARKAKDRDDIANITSDFWGKAGQSARERLETLSAGQTGVTTFPSGPNQMAPVPMPGAAQPPVVSPAPPGPSIQQLAANRAAQNMYAQNLAIIAEKHGMPVDDLAALVNGQTADMGAIARAFNAYGLKYDDVRFLQGLRPQPLVTPSAPPPTPVIHPSQIQPPRIMVMPNGPVTTPVGPFVTSTGQGIADLNRGYQQLLPLQEAALGAELPRASSGVIDRAADILVRPSVMTRLAKVLYGPAARQAARVTPMVVPAIAQEMGMFDQVNDPFNMSLNPY
ncbi:MAG: hypothetical protein EBT79_08075 [Actinobacteria bacterium]|nr:hypothetical protein [Actinomycetota bacterium]NBR67214.1 hypothetical protein [Actinomycetota bacterium]